jgi:hypothetical protein
MNTVDSVQDAQLSQAGDDYEDKYRPDWVQEVNTVLERYGLRIRQILTWDDSIAAQVVYETDKYLKYYMTPRQPTEQKLYRLVYETLEVIDELEDTMNIFASSLFPYLNGEMIGDNEVTLTIKAVVNEELTSSRGTDVKPTVQFQERKKAWILNKSNAKLLAEEMGPETDNWRGRKVVLHAPWIEAFGKRMRSVRVKKVLPPASPNGSDEEE